MNSEIASQLAQIKWIALAILVCFALVILFFILMQAMSVKEGNVENLTQNRQIYTAELSLLECQGKYEELVEKSEEMLLTFPNDVLGNWYNAIGNYKIKQFGAALSTLGNLKEINSAWSTEMVDSLIETVKESMSGPKGHAN